MIERVGSLGPPDQPMTNLQREIRSREATVWIRSISTEELRKVRAYFADVLEKGLSGYTELVSLRGQYAHAEILKREQSAMRRLGVFFGVVNGPPLWLLLTLPDLWPPVELMPMTARQHLLKNPQAIDIPTQI